MVSLLLRGAFLEGVERYGDLGFDAEALAAHVRSICAKYGRTDSSPLELRSFVESLHTLDLYLSIGCAHQNAHAWQCFATEFHPYIARLAAAVTPSEEEATELTDCVIVDLYLPDRSGRSRIGTFDGRSSLATWLRVLVSHRAVNQRKRSRYRMTIESLPDTVDETAVERLDAALREKRYGTALHEALSRACASLNDRERLVLLLRFGETQKVQEIAARLRVHPSNVTRQIDRVCERLRRMVIRTLGEHYHLSGSQIDECLPDIVENPRYSILALLEQTERAAETSGPGWPAATAYV